MKAIPLRFRQMLLGWGAIGVVYLITGWLQGAGHKIMPLGIDTLIPFSATAIWLYLSFFLLVPLGYLLVPLSRLHWLTRSMQLTALVAGAVYLLWPTTMSYPQDMGTGISSILLGWLIAVDSSQNCFPSLHMALTVLAVQAIAATRQRLITVLCVLWAIAIAFSIIQLRRHLFIDLVGGAVLAWCCSWLASRLLMRKTLDNTSLNSKPLSD